MERTLEIHGMAAPPCIGRGLQGLIEELLFGWGPPLGHHLRVIQTAGLCLALQIGPFEHGLGIVEHGANLQ